MSEDLRGQVRGKEYEQLPESSSHKPQTLQQRPLQQGMQHQHKGAGELPYSYSLPEGLVAERPAPEWRWEMRRARKRCPAMGRAGCDRWVL